MQQTNAYSSSAVAYSVLKEEVSPFIHLTPKEDPKETPGANESIRVQMKMEQANEKGKSVTKFKDAFYFCCVRKIRILSALLAIICLIWFLASYAIYIHYQTRKTDGRNGTWISFNFRGE